MSTRLWQRGTLSVAAMLALVPVASAEPAVELTEQTVRRVLTDWALAFNAGDSGAVCGIFAPELRYDYRGFPERGFDDMCHVLQGTLADQTRKYAYDVAIKEVIVSGDLAAVRLVWTLTVKRPGQIGGTSTYEPGLDIFRRQPDGSWKIVRYIAYEE
jgi:ketosteroid isomerase-like protein